VLDLQRRVLRALAEAGPEGGTAPDLARQAGAPEDTRTVFEILEHLAASGRAESRPGSDWWDASYRLPQSRGRLEA
jgi:DNA-binding IclR family transcriptional regulator